MELKYFYKGFNYSQDGPGNRIVYHLQGCNMRCPWCSNPEGMVPGEESKTASIDDIVNEILSVRPMFFENGGVTFTGGEATLQFSAIYEIMKRVKAEGVNTAIETNATSDRLVELMEVCDCFMTDYKTPLPQRCSGLGGNLEVIENNLRTISQKTHIHIRIPLIHGFNDDKTSLEGFVNFFVSLTRDGCSFDVELLPYHEYGKEKWERLGKAYLMQNAFVTDSTLGHFKKAFEDNGVKLINT